MKKTIFFFCVFLYGLLAQNLSDEFQKYPTPVYQGKPKFDSSYKYNSRKKKYIHRDGWKWVKENAKPNFAGKFFIVAYPCGASCRFWTLFDLELGLEDPLLSDFSTNENGKKTIIEGREYELLTFFARPDSLLLGAQFVSWDPDSCRQIKYLLKTSQDGKNYLEAISDYEPCDSEWE